MLHSQLPISYSSMTLLKPLRGVSVMLSVLIWSGNLTQCDGSINSTVTVRQAAGTIASLHSRKSNVSIQHCHMKISHFPDTIVSSILPHGVLRGNKLQNGRFKREQAPWPVPAPAADDCGTRNSSSPAPLTSTGWSSARRYMYKVRCWL